MFIWCQITKSSWCIFSWHICICTCTTMIICCCVMVHIFLINHSAIGSSSVLVVSVVRRRHLKEQVSQVLCTDAVLFDCITQFCTKASPSMLVCRSTSWYSLLSQTSLLLWSWCSAVSSTTESSASIVCRYHWWGTFAFILLAKPLAPPINHLQDCFLAEDVIYS